MKQILLIIAVVALAGCGNKEETTPQSQAEPSPTPVVSTPKQETPNHEPLVKDKKPGTILWESEDGLWVSSPAIGPNGTVYVGSKGDWFVYALNGKTGAKIWGFETGSAVLSTPALGADGVLYVGAYDGKIYALKAETGAKIWESEIGSEIISSPALGQDGILYVGSNLSVYAIQTDSKGLAKSPWPMFGQNAQHTGRAPK